MHWVRRLRMQAVLCGLAIALAALIVHPFAEMGVNDDWSYTRTAQLLAQTGHIVYNGWGAPILGWQLLPALLFIKLFGFSFTAVRLSMLPFAMLTAFLLQRALVRTGLNEWNASVATLTMVLSPLLLPLSLTYMTDAPGLFVVVLCLYASLRALRAASDRSAAGWISFAILSNAVGGTVRQIAWLGLLVMVPSALWLLRRRPRILAIGVPTLAAGAAFILGAMRWLGHQPLAVPEHILAGHIGWAALGHLLTQLRLAAQELPLFLLPILLPFTPALWRCGRRAAAVSAVCLPGLLVCMASLPSFDGHHGLLSLEPYLPGCFTVTGVMDTFLLGSKPEILNGPVRLLLTVLTAVGAYSFVLACATGWMPIDKQPATSNAADATSGLSWHELAVLLLPFTLAYILLTCPRAAFSLFFDRYLLVLLVLSLAPICRLYQERIAVRLPALSIAILGLAAGYSIAAAHDYFATARARLVAIGEIRSAGLLRQAIDGGFEYNFWTQLETVGYINNAGIAIFPTDRIPMPARAPGNYCRPYMDDNIPAVSPRFALSYEPAACGGAAGFAPVPNHNWLGPRNTAIYVVKSFR